MAKTKEEVYAEGRKLLQFLADIPMSRFTAGEYLFFSLQCVREAGKPPNVYKAFNQDDLLELTEIAYAVTRRGGLGDTIQ